MTNKALNNGKPLSLNTFLHSPRNIVKVISWYGLFDSPVKGIEGDFQQMGRALTDASYRKGPCGISVKTLKLNTKINGQYVTVNQRTRGRKSMHNFFVDGTAQGKRESQVALECWNNIIRSAEL